MAKDIHTETLSYTAGGQTLRSLLAIDRGGAPRRPGVVIFGEWWGLNPYLERRARELAGLGYVALAADMYGEARQAADATEAGAMMNALLADMESTGARVRAAVDALKARGEVDPARLGAMGYCLGGALSLHAARLGLDLRGVVSFHGSLGRTHKAKKGEVKAKVLVCHGAADQFVSAEELAGFRQEMADLGVDLKLIAYPEVLHGFTNPEATANGQRFNLPLRYDAEADRQSWNEMTSFWQGVLA
jgi:dienelactone hydrolase